MRRWQAIPLKPVAIGAVLLLVLYVGYRQLLVHQAYGQISEAQACAANFLTALREERLDEAASLLTWNGNWRLGRSGLAELLRQHPELRNRAETGAYDLHSQRSQIQVRCFFMVLRQPGLPQAASDYLPITVTVVVGETGQWRVDDVTFMK